MLQQNTQEGKTAQEPDIDWQQKDSEKRMSQLQTAGAAEASPGATTAAGEAGRQHLLDKEARGTALYKMGDSSMNVDGEEQRRRAADAGAVRSAVTEPSAARLSLPLQERRTAVWERQGETDEENISADTTSREGGHTRVEEARAPIWLDVETKDRWERWDPVLSFSDSRAPIAFSPSLSAAAGSRDAPAAAAGAVASTLRSAEATTVAPLSPSGSPMATVPAFSPHKATAAGVISDNAAASTSPTNVAFPRSGASAAASLSPLACPSSLGAVRPFAVSVSTGDLSRLRSGSQPKSRRWLQRPLSALVGKDSSAASYGTVVKAAVERHRNGAADAVAAPLGGPGAADDIVTEYPSPSEKQEQPEQPIRDVSFFSEHSFPSHGDLEKYGQQQHATADMLSSSRNSSSCGVRETAPAAASPTAQQLQARGAAAAAGRDRASADTAEDEEFYTGVRRQKALATRIEAARRIPASEGNIVAEVRGEEAKIKSEEARAAVEEKADEDAAATALQPGKKRDHGDPEKKEEVDRERDSENEVTAAKYAQAGDPVRYKSISSQRSSGQQLIVSWHEEDSFSRKGAEDEGRGAETPLRHRKSADYWRESPSLSPATPPYPANVALSHATSPSPTASSSPVADSSPAAAPSSPGAHGRKKKGIGGAYGLLLRSLSFSPTVQRRNSASEEPSRPEGLTQGQKHTSVPCRSASSSRVRMTSPSSSASATSSAFPLRRPEIYSTREAALKAAELRRAGAETHSAAAATAAAAHQNGHAKTSPAETRSAHTRRQEHAQETGRGGGEREEDEEDTIISLWGKEVSKVSRDAIPRREDSRGRAARGGKEEGKEDGELSGRRGAAAVEVDDQGKVVEKLEAPTEAADETGGKGEAERVLHYTSEVAPATVSGTHVAAGAAAAAGEDTGIGRLESTDRGQEAQNWSRENEPAESLVQKNERHTESRGKKRQTSTVAGKAAGAAQGTTGSRGVQMSRGSSFDKRKLMYNDKLSDSKARRRALTEKARALENRPDEQRHPAADVHHELTQGKELELLRVNNEGGSFNKAGGWSSIRTNDREKRIQEATATEMSDIQFAVAVPCAETTSGPYGHDVAKEATAKKGGVEAAPAIAGGAPSKEGDQRWGPGDSDVVTGQRTIQRDRHASLSDEESSSSLFGTAPITLLRNSDKEQTRSAATSSTGQHSTTATHIVQGADSVAYQRGGTLAAETVASIPAEPPPFWSEHEEETEETRKVREGERLLFIECMKEAAGVRMLEENVEERRRANSEERDTHTTWEKKEKSVFLERDPHSVLITEERSFDGHAEADASYTAESNEDEHSAGAKEILVEGDRALQDGRSLTGAGVLQHHQQQHQGRFDSGRSSHSSDGEYTSRKEGETNQKDTSVLSRSIRSHSNKAGAPKRNVRVSAGEASAQLSRKEETDQTGVSAATDAACTGSLVGPRYNDPAGMVQIFSRSITPDFVGKGGEQEALPYAQVWQRHTAAEDEERRTQEKAQPLSKAQGVPASSYFSSRDSYDRAPAGLYDGSETLQTSPAVLMRRMRVPVLPPSSPISSRANTTDISIGIHGPAAPSQLRSEGGPFPFGTASPPSPPPAAASGETGARE